MLPREILEGLFDEKKINILRALFNKPEEDFYLRELAREAKVSPATTYRIIKSLVDMDLVKAKQVKKTKFYRLAHNEKVEAMRGLFEEKKGVLEVFVEHVSRLEGVERIILHEKGRGDKLNILVIGDRVDNEQVNNKIGELKAQYNIDIIELTLTREQFRQMSTMGLFPGKKQQLWPLAEDE